jgi:hypothetical protein
LSPRRTQHATLKAMFQLNSWIPLVGNSSKLAVRNAQRTPASALERTESSQPQPRSQPQQTLSQAPPRRWASSIQPLEPMLLPKLRICFADFPWLHYPHGPEAIHLGVLMRIRYGPGARKEIDLRRSFHEDSQGSERYKNCIAFSMFSDACHQLKCHSRRQQRQREKRTLHGPGYPSICRC